MSSYCFLYLPITEVAQEEEKNAAEFKEIVHPKKLSKLEFISKYW